MSPEFMLRFPFPSHEVRLNKKHRARLHGVGSRVYGPGQYVQGGGLLRRGHDIAPARSASSAVYDEQKKTPRSPRSASERPWVAGAIDVDRRSVSPAPRRNQRTASAMMRA